jgi:hypothetical protein
MLQLLRFSILTACLFVGAQIHAHEPMRHDCTAPLRPVNDQDDRQWQRFLDEIDAFRECVNAAKSRHESAQIAHQQAARSAVEDWNEFARTSLNAPEDFPHEASSNNR